MFAEGFQPKARESFLGRKPNEGEVELNVLHPSGRMGSISGVADEAAQSSPRIFVDKCNELAIWVSAPLRKRPSIFPRYARMGHAINDV